MPPKIELAPGNFYHIYNRGNNRQEIFIEEENYFYFLRLVKKHILPVAKFYAYALLPNHFHFLVQIKEWSELEHIGVSNTKMISRKFGNCFNAYAKAFNKKNNRVSSLFEQRFERSLIKTEDHFTQMVFYIHRNPQKHSFIKNYKKWKFTSYQSFISNKETGLEKKYILDWFESRELFVKSHDSWIEDKEFDFGE